MKKKLIISLLALASLGAGAQNLQKGDFGYLYCHMRGIGGAGTGINTGTVSIRTQKTDCPTGWTDVCTDNTIACATFACPSKGCISDPCIEQTEVSPNPSEGCQPETDSCEFSDLYCATNDGCYCAASKDTCIG